MGVLLIKRLVIYFSSTVLKILQTHPEFVKNACSFQLQLQLHERENCCLPCACFAETRNY